MTKSLNSGTGINKSEESLAKHARDESGSLNNDPLIGEVIQNYTIVQLIGAGGMGKVYKAEHPLTHQTVAIKILPEQLTKQPESMKKFVNEAKAVARINHINVVSVSNFGVYEKLGVAYLIMEYLDGNSLSKCFTKEHKLSIEQSINIFMQICAGLSRAHEIGVVHRDIKPSNIILIENDKGSDIVKIIDFGIAKVRSLDGATMLETLTDTTETIGSPHYMSPEQCSNKAIDNRSDIYSMGCLMYQTLSGEVPYNAKEFAAVLMLHMTAEPPHLVLEDEDSIIAQRLGAIIQKCLAKDPIIRYQNISDLQADLGRIQARLKQLQLENTNPVILAIERTGLFFSQSMKKLTAALFSKRINSSGVTVGTVIGIASIVLALTAMCGAFFLFGLPSSATIADRELPLKPIVDPSVKVPDPTQAEALWHKLQSPDFRSPDALEYTLKVFMHLATSGKQVGNYELASWWYYRAKVVTDLLNMENSILSADIDNSYAESCLLINTVAVLPSKIQKEQLAVHMKKFGKFIDSKNLRHDELIFAANAATARDFSLETLRIMKNLGRKEDTPQELLALGLLARSFQELDETEEARGNYDKFSRILTSNNFSSGLDQSQLAFILGSTGRFYLEQGQFAKSGEILEKCRLCLTELSSLAQYNLVVVYNDLGLAKELSGDSQQAEMFFRQSYQVLINSNNNRKYKALILNNIATAAFKAGDYKSAFRSKLDALAENHI